MEIAYFSKTGDVVTIDKSNIKPYNIPKTNKSQNCPYGLNVLLGHHNYKPITFPNPISTIKPFLTAIDNLNLSTNQYSLISPSSLYQYIIISKHSSFTVIRKNSLTIIYNNDSRFSQNIKMSYVGIRFEDLLTGPTHQKTFSNSNSYYSIIEHTPTKNHLALYFSEIDSIDPISNKYTEIKLILCRGRKPHHSEHNQSRILNLLNYNNPYFIDFLKKLIVQCHFSLIDNVLIGVRDDSFNIRNITNFSIINHIIPFVKNHDKSWNLQEKLQKLDLIIKTIIEDKSIVKIITGPETILEREGMSNLTFD